MGEGAREGFVEWMFSVRSGPRNGLVEGVNENSDVLAPEYCSNGRLA